MSDIDNEERDARVYKLRLLGGSTRQVAEKFGISVADVDRIVDARLPHITNEFRARVFALDLERLELLSLKALDQVNRGSLAAMHAMLKICQRRSEMLGLDAPQRVDMSLLVEATKPESSTQQLRRLFEELRGKPLDEPPPSLPN